MPDDRARSRLRPTLVPRRVDLPDGAVDFTFDLLGPPRAKLRLDLPRHEPAQKPPPKTCRVCGDPYGHWHDGPFCPACEARVRPPPYRPDADYRALSLLRDARTALCHLTDLIQSLRPTRTRARRR